MHCIIKNIAPKTFMEIGTSDGWGTKVICHAMNVKRLWFRKKGIRVFSIDLPPGTDPKIIYPDAEDGHPKKAGIYCNYPFKQIFGNSYNFDFTPYYPIEGWFIDGKHNDKFVSNDTKLALKSDPKVIIWHDVDIKEVADAIERIMADCTDYNLSHVKGTRIAYAVKK